MVEFKDGDLENSDNISGLLEELKKVTPLCYPNYCDLLFYFPIH